MVPARYREEDGGTDRGSERVFLLGGLLAQGRSPGYIEWQEYGVGVWGRDAYLQISFHCHFSELRSPIPPQGIGCCCCCFFFFLNNDVVIVSGEYWRDSAIHIPVCHGLVLQEMMLFSRSVVSDSVTSWTVACQASLPHIWTHSCWCMISGLGIRCDSFFLGLCQGFGGKQLSLQLVSPHLRYPSCGASWESGKNTGLGVGMCSCLLVYIYSLLQVTCFLGVRERRPFQL